MGPESQIRYSMINAPTVTEDYISLDVCVSAALSAQSWWGACCLWSPWGPGTFLEEQGC